MKPRGKDFFTSDDLPPEAGPTVTEAERCSWPGCHEWASRGYRNLGWAALKRPVEKWFCYAHAQAFEAREATCP